MKQKIIVTTPEQLKQIITEVFLEHEKNNVETSKRIYSKNQARKELKIGYDKLNSLIEKDLIKTTADGKITETELNRYLGTIQ